MRLHRPIYLSLAAALALAAVARVSAQETADWQWLPEVKVDSSGIFLSQLVVPTTSSSVVTSSNVVLPHLRLAPAPSLGQTASFSRAQLTELAQKLCSGLVTSNWSGATQVRVSRRTRQFADSELIDLIAAALRRDYVKDLGELELHLARPLPPMIVPDEPLTLKLVDFPASGLNQNLVLRCEIWNGSEHVGDCQAAIQARIWRQIPIAAARLSRGQLLKDASIVLERRDLLAQRDAFLNYPNPDPDLELTEPVVSGMPVLNRDVRARPVIQRGRLIDGVYQDGSLSISLKVEALEDGFPGQTLRVRNPRTKREIYGKVQDEQTVLIAL